MTFTRQAAGELRRRLPRLGLTERIVAGTFHSIAQQARANDERPRPAAEDDHQRPACLVGQLMGRDSLDELVNEMDWATARGIDADRYEAEARLASRRSSADRVAEALAAYRKEKHKRGVLDLELHLLGMTVEAIESDPEFAASVQWRFRHVLVDEAQDLNPLQHRLVELFNSAGHDGPVPGWAQAIYGFKWVRPDTLPRGPSIPRHRDCAVARQSPLHTPDRRRCRTSCRADSGASTKVVSARPDGAVVNMVTTRSGKRSGWRSGSHGSIRRSSGSAQVAVLARTHAALAAGSRAASMRPGSPCGDWSMVPVAVHLILAEAYRTT